MSASTVDLARRRLVLGGRREAEPGFNLASLVAYVRPEWLDRTEEAVARIPGMEVHGRDDKGKLVIVIEAASDGELSERIDEVDRLAGVLVTALVYQAHETRDEG